MGTLRAKSLKLTATFGSCSTARHPNFTVITICAPNEHGYQLSILVHEHPKKLFGKVEVAGVIAKVLTEQ
jgi:kynureninase